MLGIVVPYRDREAHLAAFVPHLAAYFARAPGERSRPYRVLVVEQGNAHPFNRGLLLNIGIATLGDCETIALHDVDYLPVQADYSPPPGPTRIVWHGAEEVRAGSITIRHDYRQFFGGVVLAPRRDLLAVNGCPNAYWGWGSEDVELRTRFDLAGIERRWRDGTFTVLPHPNAGFDAVTLQPSAVARRNRALLDRRLPLLREQPPRRWDGLTTLAFKVVGRETIRAGDPCGRGVFEKLTVDFAAPGAADG